MNGKRSKEQSRVGPKTLNINSGYQDSNPEHIVDRGVFSLRFLSNMTSFVKCKLKMLVIDFISLFNFAGSVHVLKTLLRSVSLDPKHC